MDVERATIVIRRTDDANPRSDVSSLISSSQDETEKILG